ncbi:MAG TPA: hypothetical protein VFH95_03520 [Candidatus Kapabacteria bacterium]|nr:hypothetical protein [Candidatus Kapabacteria bacterium]
MQPNRIFRRTIGTAVIGLLSGMTMLASISMLFGCAVNDATPAPQATVKSNFFPLDNGLLYTYRRFNNNRYDTLRLLLNIGQPPLTTNTLLNTATNRPYYYIGFARDADNNLAAMLSTDTSSLMALDGTLEQGATWVADDINRIHATVITQYDDYYLPLRQQDYADVLEVEYHRDGDPPGNYTLRFFARDHGLILERQIVTPETEIASLQLLSIHNNN